MLVPTGPLPSAIHVNLRERPRPRQVVGSHSYRLIVLCRLRWHPPTRAYAQRRTAEAKTKKEIIRCLKRAVVREIFIALRTDLAPRDNKHSNKTAA